MVSPNAAGSESLMTDSATNGMAALDVSGGDAAHVKLAAEMMERCSGLLRELDDLQSYLREKKKENVVHIGSRLKNDLQRELEAMKKVRHLSYLTMRTPVPHFCVGDQKFDIVFPMVKLSFSFRNWI